MNIPRILSRQCLNQIKAKVELKRKRFTKEDEILTYATRGMEEYRGFPEFIKTVEQLQKIRPNMQVIIGGEDRVCYGCHLNNIFINFRHMANRQILYFKYYRNKNMENDLLR